MTTKRTGRPNGRPSTYSPALAAHVCELIAHGKGLSEIAKLAGCPAPATIFRWLEEHPEFRENYTRARVLQQDYEADKIIEIADRARDPAKARNQIDARKWRASKLNPKKYGDRTDLNITGTLQTMPQEALDARIAELLRKAGAGTLAIGGPAEEGSEPS